MHLCLSSHTCNHVTEGMGITVAELAPSGGKYSMIPASKLQLSSSTAILHLPNFSPFYSRRSKNIRVYRRLGVVCQAAKVASGVDFAAGAGQDRLLKVLLYGLFDFL